MKKTILILAAIGTCLSSFAQDIVVESALTSLKDHNLDEAKENIDRAIAYPGTKEKPKALYAKARIYMDIYLEKLPKYIASHPYREAAEALMKLAEVKPDYEKADVDLRLFNCAIFYNNDGVTAFNNKITKEGIECMSNVVKIHDLNGGKRYEKYTADKFPVKRFDTLAANATSSAAISYFLDSNYTLATPMLVKVVSSPITNSAGNMNLLMEAYSKTHKDKELFETIALARKQFPNDKTIRTNELYYYFKAGRQDELVKKLEEAAASEPDNAELQFNLAVTYLDMLNNKDANQKTNLAELTKKTETAFKNAISKSPDNINYNYNYGVLFYNQGKDANEKMNTLADKINEKGQKNSKEEQKQYDGLKVTRDGYFASSLTCFEKVNGILEGKGTKKTNEESAVYKNCLTALKDAYTILGKDDKYKETKDKLDKLDQ